MAARRCPSQSDTLKCPKTHVSFSISSMHQAVNGMPFLCKPFLCKPLPQIRRHRSQLAGCTYHMTFVRTRSGRHDVTSCSSSTQVGVFTPLTPLGSGKSLTLRLCRRRPPQMVRQDRSQPRPCIPSPWGSWGVSCHLRRQSYLPLKSTK